MQSKDAALLYEMRGQVAVITLNRPAKLNAVNTAMRNGLIDAWQRFEADANARVAILTASGDRAFCAGRDLSENTADTQAGFLPVLGDSVHTTKPVIAAVNGLAYGAGWFLSQCCDMIVASDKSSFALPEAKVGRGPAWACWLHGMIPQKVALEILMTGNPISAQRAFDIGLVNHVVPQQDVMTRALQLANDIVSAAPLSVAASKEMMYMAADMGRSAALRTSFHLFEKVYNSEDALEGVRAFRDKRPPVWKGR